MHRPCEVAPQLGDGFNAVGGEPCPSPLELGHYDGQERGTENGSETVFGRGHPQAAA